MAGARAAARVCEEAGRSRPRRWLRDGWSRLRQKRRLALHARRAGAREVTYRIHDAERGRNAEHAAEADRRRALTRGERPRGHAGLGDRAGGSRAEGAGVALLARVARRGARAALDAGAVGIRRTGHGGVLEVRGGARAAESAEN